MTEIELRDISDEPRFLPDIYRLRSIAWGHLIDRFPSNYIMNDCHDEGGNHFGLFDQDTLIGAIRYTVHTDPDHLPLADVFRPFAAPLRGMKIASYNHMVIHPAYRRSGLSRQLDNICISGANRDGADVLVGATGNIEDNLHRIRTMERLGFEIIGTGKAPSEYELFFDLFPTVMYLWFDEQQHDFSSA